MYQSCNNWQFVFALKWQVSLLKNCMVLIRQDIFHSQTEFLMENMQKIETENYLVSLVHRQGYTKKSLKNFPSLHVQPKIKVTSR